MPENHGGGLRLTADASQQNVARLLRDNTPGLLFSYEISNREKAFDGALIQVFREITGDRLQLLTRPTSEAEELLGLDRADAIVSETELKRASPDGVQFYSRLVDCVSPNDLPSDEALRSLGYAMAMATPAAGSSGIPVQFTYLGQFVAHDLAHTNFQGNPLDVENLKSAAFDLSSIFGNDTVTCGNPDDVNGIGGARLGYTTPRNGKPPRLEDLPRDQDSTPGQSCLPDRRNDSNLALSQLTVAILKFYRFVFENCASDIAEAQSITRRHIQSMVLHDFLPRILWDQRYQANPLELNGFERRLVNPGGEKDLFQVPVEFATAFFRFGHSMVRSKYRWGDDLPNKLLSLSSLITESYNRTLKTKRSRIDDEWVLDWEVFTAQQNSALIDCKTQTYLEELPPWAIENPPEGYEEVNLAVLSLQRGKTQTLPTVQIFQKWLDNTLKCGAPELERIGSDDLISKADGRVGAFLKPNICSELQNQTPLFYYTLREAELCAAGQHLGPLASRIVLETIHGAIAAADNNIITGEAFLTDCKLPIDQAQVFRFRDFLRCIDAGSN